MNVYEQKDAKAQIPSLEALVALRPVSTHFAQLAAAYFTVNEPEKALPLAQAAWNRNKDANIGMNLALIYKDLGRHKEAFHVLEHAYWLNPDDFYIRLGYGEALLKNGFWDRAWPVYDNARPTQQGAAMMVGVPATVREWDGKATDGPLLVINEGGMGDRLSYARWLPELTKRGIDWKFYPFEPSWNFYERIFPRERLIHFDGEEMNPAYWTTTFALPAKLNASPTNIPPPLPFTADAELVAKYKFTRTDQLPIVGLCYEAAEMHQGGRKVRSLTEGQAMRLVCMTGDKVHWVSLQHETKMPQPVTNIPFKTWEETAALITNLDGVVSVDTSIMHMAGGLNKPLATLLSANACWKWPLGLKKCIWYPTATLFKNETVGMEQAVTNLTAAIRNGLFHAPA
jgi:hypothetical protein